mmetsp:Transcript_22181/g.28944  ORF Transcript_22181/g.28944 Transcript_22181/m.28944 type:complete len:410 (-) Transcript_22181:295-1524(-)|eukprot:CAMPEP_0114389118 /NCGR_PEP_ID=MMETSP0102-20121206/8447_1 /TAXON_ID=38822 ORGANISM="Pteridomonas danica, Strain PT" /NCGR_SAMPLE_ID=MMETSP0102 /ASSEMBLY_ACC=CAM_ASM_000212 /LENGTH=409 /DNA_ID=CAMNT_0001546915 /DNA_START=19 /DNA_END=1248 /DNA_ORIENTATION=+
MAFRFSMVSFLFLVLTPTFQGEDDMTPSSQIERDDYDHKKKLEAIQGLKDELDQLPDITGQTQREGTLREHIIDKPISKNQYWSKNLPFGFDFDVTPGLSYSRADEFYEPIPAEDYSVNIIVDPCRDHAIDCCQDVFGSPQYISPNRSRTTNSVSSLQLRTANGDAIETTKSRLADQAVHYDADCDESLVAGGSDEVNARIKVKKTYDGFGNNIYTRCIGVNLAINLELNTPACWDHNTTVNATLPCQGPGGEKFPSCVAVGYYSSAYIVQCGGVYREDNHCGTFIELHAALSSENSGVGWEPGRAVCDLDCNMRVLSQTRLEGGFVGGYRTTTLPLTRYGNASQVVCQGNYELWWVQRTLWGFVTQFKKNFTVVSPECDFDIAYDSQRPYSTMDLPVEAPSIEFKPGH